MADGWLSSFGWTQVKQNVGCQFLSYVDLLFVSLSLNS